MPSLGSGGPRSRRKVKVPVRKAASKRQPKKVPPRNSAFLPADDIRTLLVLPDTLQCPKVSASSMQTYYQCPRMFLLKYRARITPKVYSSPASIGSLFHLAIGLRYRGLGDEAIVQHLDAETDKLIENLQLDSDEGAGMLFEGGQSAEDVRSQIEYDGVIARAMANAFWQTYSPRMTEFEVRDVESWLDVQCSLTGQPLIGKLDLLLCSKKSKGLYYVTDHKTTSRSVDLYVQGLGIEGWPRFYRLLAQEAINQQAIAVPPGRVAGVIVNVVQRATIRLKKGKAGQEPQSIDDYIDEVGEWYAGKGRHAKRAEEVKENPPFASRLILPTPPEKDAELQQMVKAVGEASRCSPELSEFPRTGVFTGMCKNCYGRKCPYLRLCEAPVQQWKELQPSYITRTERTVPDAIDATPAAE